ncbi:Uncharacterized protein APZ42_004157, partial [Daphnia magna]
CYLFQYANDGSDDRRSRSLCVICITRKKSTRKRKYRIQEETKKNKQNNSIAKVKHTHTHWPSKTNEKKAIGVDSRAHLRREKKKWAL